MDFHRCFRDAAKHASTYAALSVPLWSLGAVLPSPKNYILYVVATIFSVMGIIVKSPNDGRDVDNNH